MEDNRPLLFHDHHCDCTRCILAAILRVVRKIMLHLQPLTRVTLEITMPKTITVGQTASAILTATGSDGKPFTLSAADTIALNASVPADVSFGVPVFNADGTATVPVTGLNADPSVGISATVDAVVSNTDTLTITVPAPKLASVTIALQ